jgi:hypothetical protein
MAGEPNRTNLIALLGRTRTESGRTLLELVDERPVLLVFLRHFGCAFCRQAIDDVSKVRTKLTSAARKTLLRLLRSLRRGARERSRWLALS